jgi:hypothetical protein
MDYQELSSNIGDLRLFARIRYDTEDLGPAYSHITDTHPFVFFEVMSRLHDMCRSLSS